VVAWVLPVSSPVFARFAVEPGGVEIKACVLGGGSSCIIVQPVISPPPAGLHKSRWHSFRPQSPEAVQLLELIDSEAASSSSSRSSGWVVILGIHDDRSYILHIGNGDAFICIRYETPEHALNCAIRLPIDKHEGETGVYSREPCGSQARTSV
jgi:hypothetical protein